MAGTERAACEACAVCGRATQDRRFRGTHWLCGRHRRALLAKRLRTGVVPPACVTEYDLLRLAVFAFPETCAREEALARVQYVAETWHERDKPRAVLRAHRMGRVSVGAPASPLELLELVTEMTAFLIRHARVIACDERGTRAILAVCASKVAEWYPALVRPSPELARAERIVSIIRRETGTSLFLVKADVVLALRNVPSAVAERIYVAYVALISNGREGALMR